MGIEIADKSLMMIMLLEECDLACPHCVREDEPMDPGYRLSFRQLKMCLADCRLLESVSWVHFSGGEPTLWAEGDRDLVDLLLEIAASGFSPGFTTNGSAFLNYDRCRRLFRRYVDASTIPLRLYLSIDTFHRNFNTETGRSQSLDNVMRYRQELPRNKGELLDTRVVVIVSKESESLLPDEMVAHYESMGVGFGFVPLKPRGRAKSIRHLCPDLESDNPEDLGAYWRFHRQEGHGRSKQTVSPDKAAYIVLIGDDYYAVVDDNHDFRNRWQKVAQLGHLPDELIKAYSEI